ncbi:MAG: phosphoribosyltransferase [Gammaproteobacteria bacterium]
MDRFFDRYEAGKVLAEQLTAYKNRQDVIVLALPRGGVPVAFEIAQALHLMLDVFIVRKLGVPWHEELAMGAIAMGDITVLNEDIVRDLNLDYSAIQDEINAERLELKRREKKYRGVKPFPELEGKTVILVDDGIATGATMRAAVNALRELKPAQIIIAVPVAEVGTCREMAKIADVMVCPLQVTNFNAVGAWYENFLQAEDEEVHELLSRMKK